MPQLSQLGGTALTINEGGKAVWKGGAFVPGVVGVRGGSIKDKTEKPIVAVFLEDNTLGWQGGTYTVYALGREALVKKKHVYPIGDNYGIG